jgi:hypothetical protein
MMEMEKQVSVAEELFNEAAQLYIELEKDE